MIPSIRITAPFAVSVLGMTVPGCGDAPATPQPCGATVKWISAYSEPGLSTTTVDDVTGDDRPDAVSVNKVSASSYRMDVEDGAAARIHLPGELAFLVSPGAVDLDADGQRDLILGLPWHNRVLVFRGPVTGELGDTDAFLSIAGPPYDGGLAPLYGTAVLVADVNLDGSRDIVATSPAEREEGCFGQLPPRVYLGPFAAGTTLDETNVALLLPGPMGCLGERMACTDGGFSASAVPAAACYSFPLGSDEPVTCP